MKISVVTVSRNAVETIEKTLLSVQRQNYPRIEHIVIDGASNDGTVDIIKQHRNYIETFVSEPDHGIYEAMNKGIAMASGEIIGTLNADDVYADEAVLSRVAAIFSNPEINACYADLVYVDPHFPHKIVRYWRSCEYHPGLFESGWMPAHPTFFARREVYESFGDFDLNFPRQADFELTMRFLAIHTSPFPSTTIPFISLPSGLSGAAKPNLLVQPPCLNCQSPPYLKSPSQTSAVVGSIPMP